MSQPVLPAELLRLRAELQRNPGHFIAWVMLADAEMDHGDAAAGLAAAQRALLLRPGHPEALARLGRVHWMLGRHTEAVAALRQALEQAPQHAGIALWLGHALEDAGEAEAAAQAYEHAHRLMPQEPMFAAHLLNWRRKLCDWRGLDALSMQVRNAVTQGEAAVEPFAFLSEDATPAEQLACARLRARDVAVRSAPFPPRERRKETAGGTKLRLGFLSNGFGAHPTGLLTVRLFESLATHGGVEAHLFALNRDDGSVIRQRLHAAARLREVAGWPHRRIAELIREQCIDVLFDLRGWGGGGTPEVLAMRPAPVQVNWLAYPGTSGAPWIDYVLADGFALPQTLETSFSETVVRLPRCFQPSDTSRAVIAPPSRADCGLPESGMVYCCFNNSYKINPASFARMMAVLSQVPGSVLWLLSGPGQADARLRAQAQRAGVEASRLVFMRKLPHAEYMARYRYADLFLDTAPYNAHTTASDALWAGCPVLTRPGETFASRVAGSLNHHLGISEMNMDSDEAFIAEAVRLGNDADARGELKRRLQRRAAQSGLFDMDGFARDFADAALGMAKR
ncbi:O-linked N-acetylglucosamine transferase, SPINDLY family protein [Pseudoxanthomonas wuyuanensis]